MCCGSQIHFPFFEGKDSLKRCLNLQDLVDFEHNNWDIFIGTLTALDPIWMVKKKKYRKKILIREETFPKTGL